MKTKQITFCALMAALTAVIMQLAWFPYITYAVPCVASLTIMVVTIEYNKRWAILTYVISLLPIMLFCEGEAKLLFLCFMGFYPILKALLERLKSRPLEYIIKIICFNLSVLAIYLLSTFVFGVSYDDLGELGKYGAAVFIALANITFIAYDFCITKMAEYYLLKFHSTVEKMLKKNK